MFGEIEEFSEKFLMTTVYISIGELRQFRRIEGFVTFCVINVR